MKHVLIMSLLGLILGTACTSNLETTTVKMGGVAITAEIADSNTERAVGLMNRSSLPEGTGMIFVWSDESYRSFWMKNTLIPLDIIFIDANGTIVDMTTMQPCKSLFCDSYRSKAPAQYVLEVNAGFAEKRGVKIGDKVEIDPKLEINHQSAFI